MDGTSDVRSEGPQTGLDTQPSAVPKGWCCQWAADDGRGSGGRRRGCKQQLKLCQMSGLPGTDRKLVRKARGAWDELKRRLWGASKEAEGAPQIARDEDWETKILRILLTKKSISFNIKNTCFLSCICYRISCDMVVFYYTWAAPSRLGLGLYHNRNTQEAVFCLAMTPATIVFDLQPLKRDTASSTEGVMSAD